MNLYNIANDEVEQHDVAADEPAKVEELKHKLIRWEQRMNVQQYSGIQ